MGERICIMKDGRIVQVGARRRSARGAGRSSP
jgi:ABC-type proline/glycine betaine transport system ATPase subunit